VVHHGCSVDLWRSHGLCRSITRCQGFYGKGKAKEKMLNSRKGELNLIIKFKTLQLKSKETLLIYILQDIRHR
jgi:hypothetical protein